MMDIKDLTIKLANLLCCGDIDGYLVLDESEVYRIETEACARDLWYYGLLQVDGYGNSKFYLETTTRPDGKYLFIKKLCTKQPRLMELRSK